VRNPPFFIRVRDLSYLLLVRERSPRASCNEARGWRGSTRRDHFHSAHRFYCVIPSEAKDLDGRSDDRRE